MLRKMRTVPYFSFVRACLSFYTWSVVTLATVLISTMVLLTFPLALFDPQRRLAHRLGTLWGRLLLGFNPAWRLRVVGLHRIRQDASYVLVANHSSLADIVCLFSIGRQFKWLAKRSLFRIPFLGWAMSAMGYIPLERGRYGSIKKSFTEALEWLRKDISILIFPEGTRSRSGEMGHFKSGAFRLAIESQRPIAPIVLAGTRNVISKGKAAFGGSGVAYLSILPPIETKGCTVEEEKKLRVKVEGLMQAELKKRNRILSRLGR